LVNCFDDDSLLEILVNPGVCDHVIESYCTWVEEQNISPA
jgi:hypothetical protein